jgi:hypothetical protein
MWAKAALLSVLTAASAFATPVERGPHFNAAFRPNYVMPAQDRRGGNLRPLRDIVAELEARYGGRYLGHEVVERGGRVIYVIQWLMPDGETRRTFPVDAGPAN